MKRILAAVDFSGVTDAVVDLAATIAGATGAALWLIHVEPEDPDFVGYEPGPQSVRDSVARARRGHHRELQERAASLSDGGIEATPLLVQGAPADKILEEASRLHVDLIVLGSHGRGALHSLLVGSVSERVLRHADRPLLLAPARRG